MRVGGLRQIKHLPQSPFTYQFFLITTFDIAFYQSNISTSQYDKCSQAKKQFAPLGRTNRILSSASSVQTVLLTKMCIGETFTSKGLEVFKLMR